MILWNSWQIHHVEFHSRCCAWLCKFTPTWCWPRVFTRLQRVLVKWFESSAVTRKFITVRISEDKTTFIVLAWHFEIHFSVWNCCISIANSLKIVPRGPIINKISLVLIMARRRTSDETLSESMITCVTDAYMHHAASLWTQGAVHIRVCIMSLLYKINILYSKHSLLVLIHLFIQRKLRISVNSDVT